MVSVAHQAVDLELRVASNRAPVAVRLRPNQTYVALTGQILEGVPRAAVAGYSVGQ